MSFREGYKFFEKVTGSTLAASQGQEYVDTINNEIEKLVADVNSSQGSAVGVGQLKGNIAEVWHAGTFNINAALNGSSERSEVFKSNGFASVDVSTTDGKDYSLKYYSDAAASSKSQSVSYWQSYKEYIAKLEREGKDIPTIEEYLSNRNISPEMLIQDPIYIGQLRLIPSDQLQAATKFLEEKIRKLEVTRPEEVARYKDTLKMLTDKIESSDGTQSIPLTEEESRELARLAKEGVFDASEHGLSTEELITAGHIVQQAFEAGVTAATITMILKAAPELYKCIDYLIRTGKVDRDDFKKLGFAALSGAAEGFVRGSVSASLMVSCRAGFFGESLKTVQPALVGALTVLVIESMKNSYLVATGKMSKAEMLDKALQGVYTSAGSIIFGTVGNNVVPVFGYLIGSLIGGVVGSYMYSASKATYLSFAVTNGYTYFGLVEQDYAMPTEVLKKIGISVFEYERLLPELLEPSTFAPERFQASKFEAETLRITSLRRGVIGVNRVGYTL